VGIECPSCDAPLDLVVENALTAVGFAIVTYSLYVTRDSA